MPECRVYVLSSHPLFAEGLASILAHDRHNGVRVVGSGQSLQRCAGEIVALRPDVILCDTEVLRHLEGDESAWLHRLRVVEVDLRESQFRIDRSQTRTMRNGNDLIDAVACKGTPV